MIAQITRVLISSCYLPKCHDLPNAANCYGGEEDVQWPVERPRSSTRQVYGITRLISDPVRLRKTNAFRSALTVTAAPHSRDEGKT